MDEPKPVAVVAGAGPGNGAALARRFANGGYAVALLARDGAQIASLAKQINGAVAYRDGKAALFGRLCVAPGPLRIRYGGIRRLDR